MSSDVNATGPVCRYGDDMNGAAMSGGSAAANNGWTSYLNVQLLGGVVCYIAVMVLFVAAFKRGGSLTVLYPIYASTFIWAAMIAWKTEGTPITVTNLGGMLLLIVGMYLMGKQS